MQVWVGLALEFGDDALRQRLAQLNTPLVEGVDLPDGALRKDAVLVEGNKLAQNRGSEAVDEDYVGRSVAFEHAMRHQPVGRAFVLHLFGGLPEGEGFGLRENI